MNLQVFHLYFTYSIYYLGIRLSQSLSQYDGLEDLYQKSKDICQNFSLLQIGIATFHWDSSKKVYVSRPFNFYLHKQSFVEKYERFQFYQSESMNFLATQGFDFKNNFLYGLNYERLKNKEKCKQNIIGNLGKPQNKFGFFLNEKSENTKTNVLKLVKEFYETPNKNKLEVDCGNPFLARHLSKYFL